MVVFEQSKRPKLRLGFLLFAIFLATVLVLHDWTHVLDFLLKLYQPGSSSPPCDGVVVQEWNFHGGSLRCQMLSALALSLTYSETTCHWRTVWNWQKSVCKACALWSHCTVARLASAGASLHSQHSSLWELPVWLWAGGSGRKLWGNPEWSLHQWCACWLTIHPPHSPRTQLLCTSRLPRVKRWYGFYTFSPRWTLSRSASQKCCRT